MRVGDRHEEERRSRRLKLLGSVLAAAAAVVVIAIVASSGGGGSPKGSPTALSRLNGVPQQGIVLGNPKAPVTFVEFADLKCPVCRDYTLTVFPKLVDRYVRTGKVKMVMQLQHFVGNQNNDSDRAARVALAAAQQNKLWQFADLFYANQKDETQTYATDPFLRQIAFRVPGLDVNKAFAARNEATITQQLQQASSQFHTAGFHGTPSFAVGKSGGTLTPVNYSSFDISQFSGPIENALGGGT
ncbi:MAG TPA: thioredoxin domain-containing protein [Thermoleophilaceae bacterium]